MSAVELALEQFGARLFSVLFSEFCDGAFEVEINDFITQDAVKAGLVEKVLFDPEQHSDPSDCCEPGDDYWHITKLGRDALAKARGQ